MKEYFLLRNNRQSGPYAGPELAALGLWTSDLIWIEGESRHWTLASEVEELRLWVRPAPRPEPIVTRRPSAAGRNAHSLTEAQNGPLRPYQAPRFRERVQARDESALFRKQPREARALSSLMLVFLGVFCGAILLKKVVDGSDTLTPPAAAAQQAPRPEPAPARFLSAKTEDRRQTADGGRQLIKE